MTLKQASIIALLIAMTFAIFYIQRSPVAVPNISEKWWGSNEQDNNTNIRQIHISFSEKVINDLRKRLENTREQKPTLENVGWTYGVNSEFIPRIIDYWLNKYNFSTREAHLNRYPHFVTNIQGLNIHYIHVKPQNHVKGIRVLPLLIQHGWPGSVTEFYKIIPMLTAPKPGYDFVFEVIAPSLPGFGFSSGAVKPGLGSAHVALILKNLMLRLGFDKFYTQGGDWGAIITANMASLFPQHVLGMHSNMCVATKPSILLKTLLYSYFPSFIVSEENYHLMYPVSKHISRLIIGSGYLHIQATKPDTIGIAFADSPIGLAAYVLEKFSASINPSLTVGNDMDFLGKFTMDELIDNLMFYWVPNCMTSAMRLYAETFNKEHWQLRLDSIPINVPSACAQFPNEIFYQPETFLKERFTNLIHTKRMDRGGHFAAMEEPELLADDIWTAISKMEKLYKNTAYI